MPEISLKDYFAKLNTLLGSSAADEVVHHSRHILKYYPKNVIASRFLGRALVLLSRWDEGRDALRRVLSVVPDDYAAHLALSEANERMNRPDEAIWHLERAFEQRPNDKELIDALRGLYRRYRQVDNLKIQLTSAAVARQYLRSGAYTQAIDALRGALARMNDRLDLKLLLAQTLWEQGSKEEAAEIALEVLKILPDCLEANRIMAQLWLESGRPSDAQRYVNHLEGVDPYLAVELVQGEAPDDDVFRVEELDYGRSAQSEMTSARPDWLREISTAPAVVEEPAAPASELSDWASAMLGSQQPAQAARPTAEQGTTSARFAAMSQGEEPQGGLTDIFGKPNETSTAELSALFDSQSSGDDDPMAWLRETGVEIVDEEEEPAFGNLFDDDETSLPDDQDPMAWLKDTHGDAILEDNEAAGAAADDPFAWVSGASEARPVGQSETAGGAVDDSLDWLREDALLDEALDLDDISAGKSAELATQKMQIPGAKAPGAETPEGGSNVPGPRRGLTAMLQESNFDWSNKQDDVVSDDEMDEWLNQFGVNEPRKSATEAPDWLNDLEQPEMSRLEADEWFKPEETAPTPELPIANPDELLRIGVEDDEDSDWLAELTPQEEPSPDDEFVWQPPQPPPTEIPAAPEPQPPAEIPAVPEPQELPVMLPDEPEPVVDMPDWLMSLEPDAVSGDEQDADSGDEPDAEEPAEDEFAWMTDDVLTNAEGSADAALDWFAELEPETAAEPAPEAETPVAADSGLAWTGDEVESNAELLAEGMPDWLSDLQAQSAVSDTGTDETTLDTEFSWMSDEVAEPPAAAEPAAVTKPDWLADYNQEQTPATPEPVADETDFSWMTEDEGEPEAQAGGLPSWLSELQPPVAASEPAVEAVSDAEFAWMTDEEVPTEAEVEPAEAVEAPDWLSELEPAAEVSEPAVEAVSDAEFAWMTEESLSEEAEPAEAVETPDWLSELEPAGQPETAEHDLVEADITWTSDELQPPAAALEPVAAEEMDWLNELAPQAEREEKEFEADEIAADEEFVWLDEVEGAAAAESEPLPEPAPEAEPVMAASVTEDLDVFEGDELTSEDEDEFLEPTAAQNAPDWLNAMVPGLDVDYEAAGEVEAEEEEAEAPAAETAQREYAWVAEIVAAETATERPRFAFSRPPIWLQPTNGTSHGETVDDDLPDWPSDDTDADVPEWLR